MSDLLNSASLVMIPSGYAEDKVYSAVPTDGSGDLSFTRSSNGTRVNSAGLVEVCPWNLLQYSEDLSNGVWSGSNITKTTGQTDPNGGTTAATIDPVDGTNAYFRTLTSVVTGDYYTYSIYIKGSTNGQTIALYLENGIDIYLAKTLTTSWQRFDISGIATANTSGTTGLYILCGGAYSLTNLPFNIAFAQFNIGSTAKPYFPTTDRLNVPRLTYQNGGGGCPSLLLEKQSTNELTYSEKIQNAAWNVIGGDLVVTGNAVISPDGTQNAGAITLANSANRYFVHSILGLTGGVPYTYSVYMKSASGNLSVNMGGVNGLAGVMKTVTTEWQRFTYTFTPATSYGEYFGFDNRGAGSSTSGTLYFWGAQLEASSYPTSYIPTTSASATRVADACSKTGISSLIGVNQGSIFLDFDALGIDAAGGNYLFDLSDGTNFDSNRIAVYWTGVTTLNLFYGYGGTTGAENYTSNFATTKKIAIRWTSSQIQIIIDGVAQTAVTYGNSSPTKLNLGSRFNDVELLNYKIKECVLFNTTQTTADLIALTS
jgi:hypothetical protein